MSENVFLKNIPLTNFDASTLNGTYQAINGTGTEEPINAFKFYNSSSSLIIISYDGVTDHDFVPPSSIFIYDAQSNAEGVQNALGKKALRKLTVVYAKTSSDTDRLLMAGWY